MTALHTVYMYCRHYKTFNSYADYLLESESFLKQQQHLNQRAAGLSGVFLTCLCRGLMIRHSFSADSETPAKPSGRSLGGLKEKEAGLGLFVLVIIIKTTL